jgi:thiol:disulfide interchange protein
MFNIKLYWIVCVLIIVSLLSLKIFSTKNIQVKKSENIQEIAPVKFSQTKWLTNYDEALAEAKRLNKPMFIDFTGIFCTNCRWMESKILSQPEVENLLNSMVCVRLYTDRNNDVDRWNKNMMTTRYNCIELPLYSIVSPNDEIIDTHLFTRNQAEFIEFINKGSGKK